METMFQYINETPAQCRYNINNSKELTKKIVDAFMKKDYKRIEIIASGSSYNGSLTAKYYVEKILKMKVEVITSFTVNHFEEIFDDNTFYIGMSQSGRSMNTNDAMKKVQNRGYKIIGVTGNVDSVMKNNCDVICNWGMGIEKIGFVTKGYTTSVLFYMLFALEAALLKNIITKEEYDKEKKELIDMCDVMEQAIPIVDNWYSRNAYELTNLKRLEVLGNGSGYGLALEGSLKIQETMGVASTGIEMEEFLHGPCYELNDDKTVIVIDHCKEIRERVQKLFKEVHIMTKQVFMITSELNDDPRVVSIPCSLDQYKMVLVEAIALQTIAAHGREKWLNPLLDKRIAFTEAMNTKSAKTGKEVGL